MWVSGVAASWVALEGLVDRVVGSEAWGAWVATAGVAEAGVDREAVHPPLPQLRFFGRYDFEKTAVGNFETHNFVQF